MIIDNNGPYRPDVIEIDVKGYDLQVEYRDSAGNIFMLYGTLTLDLDNPTDYQTIADFTIDKLNYAGGGAVKDNTIIELVARELLDYYDHDLIHDAVTDNRCGNY